MICGSERARSDQDLIALFMYLPGSTDGRGDWSVSLTALLPGFMCFGSGRGPRLRQISSVTACTININCKWNALFLPRERRPQTSVILRDGDGSGICHHCSQISSVKRRNSGGCLRLRAPFQLMFKYFEMEQIYCSMCVDLRANWSNSYSMIKRRRTNFNRKKDSWYYISCHTFTSVISIKSDTTLTEMHWIAFLFQNAFTWTEVGTASTFSVTGIWCIYLITLLIAK